MTFGCAARKSGAPEVPASPKLINFWARRTLSRRRTLQLG